MKLYYQFPGTWFGDCMPFGKGDEFFLFHQRDNRNPEPFGEPFGWDLATTKDFVNYENHGVAIPRGAYDAQDQFIFAGSVFEGEGQYHIFYTGYNRDYPAQGRPAQVLMHAVSDDLYHWTKTQDAITFTPQEGYDPDDWRDPWVIRDEEHDQYLLILGARKIGPKTCQTGRTVKFTSKDLKDWKFEGDFWAPNLYTMHEMPDLFKMGDWWYLVYSDQNAVSRKVCYFKGSTLDELKQMTAAPTFPDNKEGVLDSRAFYAGKTASNGTDRYIWGWCPTRAGNDNTAVGAAPAEPEWAGNLVMHKIIQHEDGTLSLGYVDGILNKYTDNTALKVMAQSETGVAESNGNYTLSGDAYVLFNRLNVHNKLTFTVTASSNEDIFGISLVRGTDSGKYYSLIINPEDNNSNRKINFEQKGKEGMGFIAGIDSYKFPVPADNIYHVTICTDNSVCTVYINYNVAYTNRIYGIQKNCWSLDSYAGSIQVSDIKVSCY